MIWFRHASASHNDPFVVDLMMKFKADGYVVWFITLEILASEDALDASTVISEAYLTRNMFLDLEKIKIVLQYAHEKGKLKIKFLKEEISIFCPNLKAYRDEYSKRKERESNPDNDRTMTGQHPDNGRVKQIKTEESKVKENKIDYKSFENLWNESGYPKITTPMSEDRKEKLRIRLKNPGFNLGAIIEKAKQSNDFIQSYITFDWITERDKNWRKVMEGNYIDKKNPAPVDPKDLPLRFVKKKDGKHYILNNDDDNYPYPFDAFERIRKQQEDADHKEYPIEEI